MTRTDVPVRSEPLEATNAPVPTPVIADPGPLGLAGFAMTTFVLSAVNAGWFTSVTLGAALALAVFYGGVAQLLAGMWEFRKGNTFGALAFSSYGAFWLSFWFYATQILPTLGSDANKATGLFLLGWLIFTAYMTIASLRVSAAVAGVFIFLTLTYLFLVLGDFGLGANLGKIGGYLGIVTAVIAWYASFAGVTNSTFKRTVLPTFPLG